MSLLDQIFARSQEYVDPATLQVPEAEMYRYMPDMGFPASMPPKSMTQPAPPPPKPKIMPQMAAQAGILAPGSMQTGTMPQPGPPAPAAPPVDVTDPETVPLPIPLPQARPTGLPMDANAAAGPADAGPSGGASSPGDLITPAQKQSLAQIAPTLAGSGSAPTTALPSSPFGPSSILDKITSGLGNNSNTLLALAAGFAGAPNIGQGISRAAAAAIPARAADQRAQLAAQGNKVSIAAMLEAKVPMQLAVAAQSNPTLMKAVTDQYFSKDKFKVQQTGEDPLTGKTYQLFNESDGTFKPIPGVAASGASGSSGSSGGIGDMSKTGPEYMATVPKIYAPVVSGMIDGTIQPPSSFALSKPYWQTMLAAAKNADPSFDENTWAGRHKMTTDLSSSGNSSMGGILANGKSAFEHLATYSGKLADVGDYNGPDVPGGGTIASVGNFVGNRLLPTSTNLGKIAGANSAGLKYGQESTKFYAGSGGGAEERMSALTNNDAKKTTGNEQAGFLQTEKELMLGRLRQKESQVRSTMGDSYLQKHPIFTPDLQEQLSTIDRNIAKLRGTGPDTAPAAPVAPVAPVKSGSYVWTPNGGLVPK